MISKRGVARHDLHASQPGGPGSRPRGLRILRVQLHQARADIVPPRVPGEYLQQVAALPGAQADHLQRARRDAVQHGPDLHLNRHQPSRQRRVWTVVIIVPAMPVHGAHHTTTASRRRLTPGLPGRPRHGGNVIPVTTQPRKRHTPPRQRCEHISQQIAMPIATRRPVHTASAKRRRIFITDAIMSGLSPTSPRSSPATRT